MSHGNQGKLKEAKGLYERAFAGYEKLLGADHLHTLFIVLNLAHVFMDQGKLEEAKSL